MRFILNIILGVALVFSGVCAPAYAKKTVKAPVGITTQNVDKKIQAAEKKAQSKAEKQTKQDIKTEKKAQAKADKQAKQAAALNKKAQKSAQQEQKKLAKEQSKSQKISQDADLVKTAKTDKKAEKKLAKEEKKAAKKSKNTDYVASDESENNEKKVKSSKKSSKTKLVGATPIEREQILLEERHLDANKQRSKLAMYLNPNLGIREVRASHILVKKRKEAVQIKKDIEKGVITFEDAARQYSLCPSSMNGGDLGYFDRKKMEPMFSETAFDLKVGEISSPVGTKFGWHIIKTTDKR